MSELKEAIGIPSIGGELVARFVKGSPWMDDPTQKIDHYVWEVRIVMSGPDARYNPGRATLTPTQIQALVTTLSSVLEKMRSLKQHSFQGEFSKVYEGWYNPSFDLRASRGDVYLLFYVSNDTRWKFSRMLREPELANTIEILKSVESKGNKLVETLKAINA